RHTVERDAYRVLSVHLTRAAEASLALSQELNTEPVLLDQRLWAHMKQQTVAEELMFEADRAGEAGPAWSNLLRLAEKAAEELADELLPPKQPLLLTQPGLLARYGLNRFLLRLAE